MEKSKADLKVRTKESPTFIKTPKGVLTRKQANDRKKVPKKTVEAQTEKLFENKECQTDVRYTSLLLTDEILSRGWLSDKSVTQHIELVNFVLLKDCNLCIMNPLIIHAVKNIDSYSDYLEPLKLCDKNFILIPLNDSEKLEEEGGSHWSTLIFNKKSRCFFHYDSIKGKNIVNAKKIAEKIQLFTIGENIETVVIEMESPQQMNGYDCGVYMLHIIDMVVADYLKSKTIDLGVLDNLVLSNEDLIVKRSIMAYIVNNNYKIPADLLLSLITITSNKDSGLTTPNASVSDTISKKIDHQKTNKWQTACTKNKQTRRFTKNNLASRNKYPNNLAIKNKYQDLDSITDCTDLEHTPINIPQHISSRSIKLNKSNNGNMRRDKKLTITSSSSIRSKRKLQVICDSQGRGLAAHLEHINNDKFHIFNHCQPGAPIQRILDTFRNTADFMQYSKSDYVVVIAGTNNILKNIAGNQLNNCYLEEQLKAFVHTNLIMATIPYRYDLQADSPENKIIKDINCMIRQLSYSLPHVQLLDLYLLQSYYHTKHGLHINNRGKKFISKNIMEYADKLPQEAACVVPSPQKTPDVAHCISGDWLPEDTPSCDSLTSLSPFCGFDSPAGLPLPTQEQQRFQGSAFALTTPASPLHLATPVTVSPTAHTINQPIYQSESVVINVPGDLIMRESLKQSISGSVSVDPEVSTINSITLSALSPPNLMPTQFLHNPHNQINLNPLLHFPLKPT